MSARNKSRIPVPKALAFAFKAAPEAQAAFEALAPSCRREYIDWISSAKQRETIDRRVEQTIARLLGRDEKVPRKP